ncbi:protein NETWORKED 4A-like [Gigantopelta aegis]|uniref:protein NETWORKED 4A-like n=1 Tax=Gigantopelta aegis TaxID=1735272 RepID=UPI001B88DF66|nr:protein NETWORKED 4A-like [Gigantopelta aegis]
MSQSKGKKTRPLGLIRHSVSTDDKFHIHRLLSSGVELKPDVKPEAKPNVKLDKNYKGIQGNAVSVSGTSSQESSRDIGGEKVSPVKEANKLQESSDKKELKEALAREKSLKLFVSNLEKIIKDLRTQLKDKEQTILEMGVRIETQMKQHAAAIELETMKHEDTKKHLEMSNEKINSLNCVIHALKEDHSNEIERLREEIEKLKETICSKDKDIVIRDEKLGRLKLQMADALKGNSWERQQQLEELTKELARLQDESDMLRIKLKSYSKTKQGHCSNCTVLTSKLEKIDSAARHKDQMIKELNSLIAKYESQLTKQDELLKVWADSKGYKVSVPK